MPKVFLKFDLPEESEEYKTTMKAGDMHSALWDFSQYLRNEYKYKEEKAWPNLEVIRQKFFEVLNENDVEL